VPSETRIWLSVLPLGYAANILDFAEKHTHRKRAIIVIDDGPRSALNVLVWHHCEDNPCLYRLSQMKHSLELEESGRGLRPRSEPELGGGIFQRTHEAQREAAPVFPRFSLAYSMLTTEHLTRHNTAYLFLFKMLKCSQWIVCAEIVDVTLVHLGNVHLMVPDSHIRCISAEIGLEGTSRSYTILEQALRDARGGYGLC
jgi:hypothetical protein